MSSPSQLLAGASSVVQGISDLLWAIYFPLCEAYLPVVLVLSICGNSLCLLVFLGSRAFEARTSRNARIFYITLAVVDIFAVIATPFPWFLGDGLYGISGGTFYFYIDQKSNTDCICWKYAFHVAESMCSWTMALLNFDRLVNLTHPFHARHYLNQRNTKIILGITAVFCSLISLIAIEFYRVVYGSMSTKTGTSCSAQTQGRIWYGISEPLVLGIGGFVAPTLIMFGLLIFIARQVIRIRTGHAFRVERMSGTGSSQSEAEGSGESSKSSNETLATIISMSTCHLIVYLPFPIVWTSRISFGFLFPNSTYQLLWALQRFCLMLAQMVHIWNIMFYFTRIDVFRTELLRLLSFNRMNRFIGSVRGSSLSSSKQNVS